MGRAATGKPGKFSLQVIAYVRAEVLEHGGDLSGRWLAARTSMSPTYIKERLQGLRPFNTNDLHEISAVFSQDAHDFVRRAVEIAREEERASTPDNVTVLRSRDDEVDLADLDQAATSKPDTGEPETP